MKRSLALILALLLLLALCACTAQSNDTADTPTAQTAARLTEAYLADGNQTDDPDALTARVAADLALLEPTAFRHWVALDRVEEETLTYRMTFDGLGVTDTLRVEKQDSGDVVIRITQGDLEDLWTYQGNGEILCNGERVKDCETMTRLLATAQTPDRRTTLQAAPVSYFNQDPQSAEEVLADPGGFTLGESQPIYEFPMPGQVNRLTVASVIQVLSAATAHEMVFLFETPTKETFSALCAAAGRVGEEAQAVVLDNGSSKALSMQLHPFTGEDGTTVYAIRTCAKEGLHGAHFLWGILEKTPA